MSKERNSGESSAAKFFDEKGFYIVLILCVLAVGIAGYVFFFAGSAEEDTVEYNDLTVMDDYEQSVIPSYDELPAANEQMEDEKITVVDKLEDEPVVNVSSEAVETVKKKDVEVKKTTEEKKQEPEPKPEPKPEEKTAPTFFVRPVNGEVMTEFSGDELVFNKTTLDWRTHNGVDFAASEGEKVLCIADGSVEDIYTDTYYGTSVLVDHGGELKSVYTGLIKNAAVYIGQEMKAGDVVGAVDTDVLFESGLAPHVHVEVIQNGERIDPMSLIQG